MNINKFHDNCLLITLEVTLDAGEFNWTLQQNLGHLRTAVHILIVRKTNIIKENIINHSTLNK